MAEGGLGLGVLTLDDFALRREPPRAFVVASSLLWSGEVERSLAQCPLEEVEAPSNFDEGTGRRYPALATARDEVDGLRQDMKEARKRAESSEGRLLEDALKRERTEAEAWKAAEDLRDPNGRVSLELVEPILSEAVAARASNGMTQPVAALGMHHVHWNAHFGHPLPKNVLRKHIKKKPKVVQPSTCEVCKIQCDTLEVVMIHKQGKKHKKNLERLQDSITPKPIKPPSNVIGPNVAPAAVANCTVPAAQPKSSAATPEELEVKKRRVLEAGAARGEVKICTVCNGVFNSQKVYEFHIAGQKHQAMVQKQQALQFVV
ncbi:uncharacterized protein LOC133907200 [Phragmites australis]|uniref:uncharacterized protein LOC133907200 n=1 Tax=Phragmites australis TaxID=29695 RepID=UPI002D7682A2|nr:uncharacterized protein LOC133907200 [Phragmites australis]